MAAEPSINNEHNDAIRSQHSEDIVDTHISREFEPTKNQTLDSGEKSIIVGNDEGSKHVQSKQETIKAKHDHSSAELNKDGEMSFEANGAATAIVEDLEKMSVKADANDMQGTASDSKTETVKDKVVDGKSTVEGHKGIVETPQKGCTTYKHVQDLKEQMDSLDLEEAAKRPNADVGDNEGSGSPKVSYILRFTFNC